MSIPLDAFAIVDLIFKAILYPYFIRHCDGTLGGVLSSRQGERNKKFILFMKICFCMRIPVALGMR
jgi:hypothetical protein